MADSKNLFEELGKKMDQTLGKGMGMIETGARGLEVMARITASAQVISPETAQLDQVVAELDQSYQAMKAAQAGSPTPKDLEKHAIVVAAAAAKVAILSVDPK